MTSTDLIWPFVIPYDLSRPHGSVADPERFDADQDPTFQADAYPAPEPDPNFFS